MVENTSGPYQKHKNNSDENMEIEDEDIGVDDYPESEGCNIHKKILLFLMNV